MNYNHITPTRQLPPHPREIDLADVTFLVVDVETTGHSPVDHRVTEVACVSLRDNEIIDEYSSLVNPRQHIPAMISRITGITDAMVWNAPEANEVFHHVRRLFAQSYSVFVAHNVSFDWSFVQHSIQRAGLPLPDVPRLCTYKLSKRLFPKQKKLNLGALASYFDITIPHRHRAHGDAFATAQVLVHLLSILRETYNVQSLDDLLGFQNKRLQAFKPKPRSIERLQTKLSLLPDEPGVYYFRNLQEEILYIGKAKSLRDRVLSYFQQGAQHQPKIVELVKNIRDVQWTTTGTELSALLLESKEIKAWQPRYNTMIKRYRRYPFLRLGDEPIADGAQNNGAVKPQGVRFPRLELCFEIMDDGAEYFGPFGSRGAAEAVVDIIDRIFRLRKCHGVLHPNAAATPCFYYQIQRCGAPCTSTQSGDEYLQEVETVRKFLSGEREGILTMLRSIMAESAEKLEFEEAALRRNQVKELERVFFRQQQISTSIHQNNLIVVLPTAERYSKVEVFFIRHGRLMFQRLVGKKIPFKELERSIESVYGEQSTPPEHCRKEEIDEIRIIASWIYQHRNNGLFLYTASLTTDTIAERLTDLLYTALTRPAPPQTEAERQKDHVYTHLHDTQRYEPFED